MHDDEEAPRASLVRSLVAAQFPQWADLAVEPVEAGGTSNANRSTRAPAALDVPEWRRAPVWIDGDVLPGNLLVQEGRPSAVIDFGCLTVGDPACEATWALSLALIALPYYVETNLPFASVARTIQEVIAERS